MANETNVTNSANERSASLESQISAVVARVDMLVGEMRDRDNQRANEIAEMRKKHDEDVKNINSATDAKIAEIKNSVDSMGKHIQTLTITAMVGIIAAGIGVAAMVWSVINR